MDLLEAKKQDRDLYRIEFADNTAVVFRLLSWREYKYYQGLYSQKVLTAKDETLFNHCLVEVVNNEDRNKLRAGVIHTITNVILSLSGPSDIDDWQVALENARKDTIPTLFSQIEMVICSAFPAYKPEDIWDMEWPMIVNRLAQAESILLQIKRISKPLTFKTDNKKRLPEDLVKDAKRMERVDRSTPVGQQHPIGRESNWKK